MDSRKKCPECRHFVCECCHEENRPYPGGIAFDEAWRQRQRADKAERVIAAMQNDVKAVIDVLVFVNAKEDSDELILSGLIKSLVAIASIKNYEDSE